MSRRWLWRARRSADGLACICSGAGGHTGQINPFAFVSAVRQFFQGPLVVGGGISDGWGLVSAGLTGIPASWLAPPLRAHGLDPNAMPAAPARNYNSNTAISAKRWMDVGAAGQGLGSIEAVEPVAVVVERIAAEFEAARARMIQWRPSQA